MEIRAAETEEELETKPAFLARVFYEDQFGWYWYGEWNVGGWDRSAHSGGPFATEQDARDALNQRISDISAK